MKVEEIEGKFKSSHTLPERCENEHCLEDAKKVLVIGKDLYFLCYDCEKDYFATHSKGKTKVYFSELDNGSNFEYAGHEYIKIPKNGYFTNVRRLDNDLNYIFRDDEKVLI